MKNKVHGKSLITQRTYPMKKSILIIVTSCAETPKGAATGIWLEEFAVPFNLFNDNGFSITVASVKGGKAPVDPRSDPDVEQQKLWSQALETLTKTISIKDINPDEYDAVFFPGGHGTMFDLPNNSTINLLLRSFDENKKVIATVCHGPACFIGTTLKDGSSLLAGRRITGFTNEEEVAAEQSENMPFLLETKLLDQQANYVKQSEWSDHIEIDENIITGQNPQSSKSVAKAIIKKIKEI